MKKRVVFDFEVFFTNGGGIQGQDFRLDIAGDEITDEVLADYIIQDMRLLMVGEVNILKKYYIEEPHKREALDEGASSDLIDLSHVIFDGLVTYKGFPPSIICDYLSREQSRQYYDNDTSFQISKVEMVVNTGTYMDVPFHRFEEGKDLSEIELDKLVDLKAVTIDARNVISIGKEHFIGKEIREKAVIVHTGWAKYWNTPQYIENHPYLTEDAASYLRDCQVKLVAIDSYNIDDTRGRTRPVHTTLLSADIWIVEHLCNLQMLPTSGYLFNVIPPKIKSVGTFPVRAFAKLRS